jgi:hypothetical protein
MSCLVVRCFGCSSVRLTLWLLVLSLFGGFLKGGVHNGVAWVYSLDVRVVVQHLHCELQILEPVGVYISDLLIGDTTFFYQSIKVVSR